MTDFNIPTGIRIRASRFGLEYNTQTYESPLSRYIQRNELDGARWFADYTLTVHKRAEIAEVQAFLLKLKGKINRFNAYDPDGKTARGSASSSPGTPLVAGGSQTGNSLNIDGATALAATYLLPGDYFSVNGELKMITDTIATDSSGAATLTFEPSLRASPSDNAVITVANCTVPMILIADDMGQWSVNHNGLYQINFSGVEAFS